MTISLRRYIAGDVALVTPRLIVAHEAEALDTTIGLGVPAGKAWTATLDGKVLGCGGLVKAWAGRFLAWTWIGDVPFRVRPEMEAYCAGAIAECFANDGATRVEAHTPVGHTLGQRFLKRLGFIAEGVAQNWVGRESYLTFARIHSTLAEARLGARAHGR